MKSEKKNRTVSSGLIIKPLPYPLLAPCYPLATPLTCGSKTPLSSAYAPSTLRLCYKRKKRTQTSVHQRLILTSLTFLSLGTFEPSPNLEPSTCLKVLQYSS